MGAGEGSGFVALWLCGFMAFWWVGDVRSRYVVALALGR